MTTRNVILTGFDLYGDYSHNSSSLVAEALHGTTLDNWNIIGQVYPAEISKHDRGTQLLGFASINEAAGIICLGMSSKAKCLRLEHCGINEINSPEYCPKLGIRKIRADRPLSEKLLFDHRKWNLAALRAAFPGVEESDNPHGFCGNQLIYQLLAAQQVDEFHSEIPVIYLHLPCSEDKDGSLQAAGKVIMPIEKTIEGIRVLLNSSDL